MDRLIDFTFGMGRKTFLLQVVEQAEAGIWMWNLWDETGHEIYRSDHPFEGNLAAIGDGFYHASVIATDSPIPRSHLPLNQKSGWIDPETGDIKQPTDDEEE